jgi:hypothetical protein
VKRLSTISEGTVKTNNECRKVIYMGDVQGPQKVNDTYVKTMHAGLMDRSFTVSHYTMGSVATFRNNEISQTVYQTCHLLDSCQTGFKKCLENQMCLEESEVKRHNYTEVQKISATLENFCCMTGSTAEAWSNCSSRSDRSML